MSEANGKNGKRKGTKFSPEIAEKICGYLSTGCYLETAAALAGVSKSALWEWIDKGRKGKAQYVEFVEQVDRALAKVQVTALAVIRTAADKHWQAAAWLLERRWPNEWGRQDTVKIVSKLAAMPDDELRKMVQSILERHEKAEGDAV